MKLTYSAVCLCCLIVLGALAADLHSTPAGHWPTFASTSMPPAEPDERAASRDDEQDDRSGDDELDDEQAKNTTDDESKSDAQNDDAGRLTLREEDLDLEKLFPERSFFGPAARELEFSHDGRYGAYLYRPLDERRHGNDLWLYDTQTGEATRITMATVMAEFQESARDVVDDRIEHARKSGAVKEYREKREQKEEEGEEQQQQNDRDDGDDAERNGDAEPGHSDPIADADINHDLSGRWRCTVTAEEVGSVNVNVRLVVRSDHDITGSITSLIGTAQIDRGRYDEATGNITLHITSENGETATFDGTISNGEVAGVAETRMFVAEITGRRIGELEHVDDEDDQQDEQRDDSEQEEDKDKDKDIDDKELDRERWGNWVADDDHERRRAPRYSGVSTYTWSPNAAELLFVSEGDVYRLTVDEDQPDEKIAIDRLTKTNDSLRDVQYWPDGTAFTYMQGGSLMKVRFDSHLIMQLDPRLPRGESMSGYRVSPDGRRMVFLTSRTIPGTGSSRTVTIVNYRDRFARTREVRRTVSDDPQRESEVKIYLYEMSNAFNEESRLAEVYSYRSTRPRDVHLVPRWAPDSSRVAFARFEQTTGHVSIYEASLSNQRTDADDDVDNGDSNDDRPVHEIEIRDAEEVYRFLHYGGPNTPRLIEPFYLADSRRLAFITEQSGYRHVHRLDPTYQALDQLTRGRFEVYPIDVCQDHRWMFARATAEHLTREDVYRIDLENGDMQRLSSLDGRHLSPAVCPKGEHVLSNFVAYGRLRELIAFSIDNEPTVLTDSHPEKARRLTSPEPEMFTYKNRHGQEIYGMMFKPDDWTEADQRPLLIYVYGGPLSSNRKQVLDGSYGAASYFFAYYMAKKHGYVTVTIDPRGTSGYGGMFEKANFERVGEPQTEDLVDGVKWLVENHGVDEDRIGIHGWSFGGFQTQMCMYTEPDVFHVGIAGAGPTEWHNYNSWYSTGTIAHNPDGETDLEEYSLIPLAKNLEGRLLLVHGMEDSNVLYQDTVKVYKALLEAGKETNVELFLDPTGGHGLGGHVKRLNRYRKYEDFLLQHLGAGEPAESDDPGEAQPAEDSDEPVTVDVQSDNEEDEQADNEVTDAP